MSYKNLFLTLWGIISIYNLSTSSVLGQTRWKSVGISVDSNTYYVDKNIKKNPNGTILVWEKAVYPDGQFFVVLIEWNCSEESRRIVQGVTYNSNRSVIARKTTKDPFRYVTPDSVESAMFEMVCSSKNSSKSIHIPSSKLFAQIIIKKANLMKEANPNSEVIRKVSLGTKLILVSEESLGVWYQVFDSKTNSQGWLNGNSFKIVKPGKSSKKIRKSQSK